MCIGEPHGQNVSSGEVQKVCVRIYYENTSNRGLYVLIRIQVQRPSLVYLSVEKFAQH